MELVDTDNKVQMEELRVVKIINTTHSKKYKMLKAHPACDGKRFKEGMTFDAHPLMIEKFVKHKWAEEVK